MRKTLKLIGTVRNQFFQLVSLEVMFQHLRRACRVKASTWLPGTALPIALIHILIANPASAACGACDTSYCEPFNASACAYGVVKDECNCCDTCAKGPGEACGGAFGGDGYCAEGYECIVHIRFGLPCSYYLQEVGICTPSELHAIAIARFIAACNAAVVLCTVSVRWGA